MFNKHMVTPTASPSSALGEQKITAREQELINKALADFQISADVLQVFQDKVCEIISRKSPELKSMIMILSQPRPATKKPAKAKPVKARERFEPEDLKRGEIFFNIIMVLKSQKPSLQAGDYRLQMINRVLTTIGNFFPEIFTQSERNELGLSAKTKTPEVKSPTSPSEKPSEFETILQDFTTKLKEMVVDKETLKYSDKETWQFMESVDTVDHFDFDEFMRMIQDITTKYNRDMFVRNRDNPELSWQKKRDFLLMQETFFNMIVVELHYIVENKKYHDFLYFYYQSLKDEFRSLTSTEQNVSKVNIEHITSLRSNIDFVIPFLVMLDQVQFFYDSQHGILSSKKNSAFLHDFATKLQEKLKKNPSPGVALRELCAELNTRAAKKGGVDNVIKDLTHDLTHHHAERILGFLIIYVAKKSSIPKSELAPYAWLVKSLENLRIPDQYKIRHQEKAAKKSSESKSQQKETKTDAALVFAFTHLHKNAPETPGLGRRMGYQVARVFTFGSSSQNTQPSSSATPASVPADKRTASPPKGKK